MSETVASKPDKKKKSDLKKKLLADKLRKTLSEMPEALRGEIVGIMEEVAELDSNDIVRRYDIGHRLNSVIEDKSGKYGVDARRSVGAVLRLSKDSVGGMIKVASSFTKSDLDRLVKMSHPVSMERLRWNHIVFLSRVPDKSKAFEYAQKAIDLGWTTKDLGKAIIRSSGGPRSAGGRKPKKHETLDQALNDLVARVRQITNLSESSWLAPGGLQDMFDKEVVQPEVTPSTELIRQLTEAYDESTKLALQVAVVSSALLQLKSRAESLRAYNKRKIT